MIASVQTSIDTATDSRRVYVTGVKFEEDELDQALRMLKMYQYVWVGDQLVTVNEFLKTNSHIFEL